MEARHARCRGDETAATFDRRVGMLSQHGEQPSHRRKALRGVGGQPATQCRADPRWYRRRRVGQHRRAPADFHLQGVDRVAGERPRAKQDLPRGDTERVLIGERSDLGAEAARLLLAEFEGEAGADAAGPQQVRLPCELIVRGSTAALMG